MLTGELKERHLPQQKPPVINQQQEPALHGRVISPEKNSEILREIRAEVVRRNPVSNGFRLPVCQDEGIFQWLTPVD
jgi:hypothetical protein